MGGARPITVNTTFRQDYTYDYSNSMPEAAVVHSWRAYLKRTLVQTSPNGYTKTTVTTYATPIARTGTDVITYNPDAATFNANWSVDIDLHMTTFTKSADSEEATFHSHSSAQNASVLYEQKITDEMVFDHLKTLLDAVDWATVPDKTIGTYSGANYWIAGITSLTDGIARPTMTLPRSIESVSGNGMGYAFKEICRTNNAKGYTLSHVSVGGNVCVQKGDVNSSGNITAYTLELSTEDKFEVLETIGAMEDVAEVVTRTGSPWFDFSYWTSPTAQNVTHGPRRIWVPYKTPIVRTIASGGIEKRFMEIGAQLQVPTAEQTGCEEGI